MPNSIQESSTKFVEEAWVFWKAAQWKPQSTLGRQRVPIRAFHIHFPIWVNFGTKYRHTTGTGKAVLFWRGEPWNRVTFWKLRTPWWSLCRTAWRSAPLAVFIRKQGNAHRRESFSKKGKGKGKFHPITGHEGPEGEQRYSSTLPLTSALHVGGWSTPRPGRFTPRKETRYPLYRRLGGPKGRVRKISPLPRLDPQAVQPVASRYTDWAIAARSKIVLAS